MFSRSQPQKPSFLRGVVAFFVLASCVRVWVGPAPVVQSARAQIPDSGMQRKMTLDEIRRTNQLLAEIKHILGTGTLNVRIKGADNTSTDNRAGTSRARRGSDR